MTDKIMVVEYWHKGGTEEKFVLLSDYVKLQQELKIQDEANEILTRKLAESQKTKAFLLDELEKRMQDSKKLSEALEVIRFYGDPESWMRKDSQSWSSVSPKSHGDKELIRDYHHPGKDWVGTIEVGGKRARDFLKQCSE